MITTGVDALDPANHGKPLWIVYGVVSCFPQIICAKLLAYAGPVGQSRLLEPGTAGDRVCIWGYSVYRRTPGFRTLGQDVTEWASHHGFGPFFFETFGDAAELLRKTLTPRAGTR